MSKRKFLILPLIVIAMLIVMTASAQAPVGSGWWSGFTIQNADQGTTQVVAEAFWETDGSASTYTSSVALPAGYAVTFHPGLGQTCDPTVFNGCRIGFTPEIPSPFQGSVVVSASGPSVAFANVNNNPSGSVGVSGGTARSAYQGTGGGTVANTLFFPTVKNDFAGQSTAFFVQAAGGDANVDIQYKMNNGDVKTESKLIKANRMYAFLPSAAGVQSCNGGTDGGSATAKCFGGATVTSDAPVAGTVVEYAESASVAQFVLATRGLAPVDTGPTIVAPTMKNNFFGGTTGATILNTHPTNTATVDLDFSVTNTTGGSCSASIGDTASDQVTIGPQKSIVVNYNSGNVGGLPNCVFYAMVASTASQGGEDIGVTVNESQAGGARKAVYSGFNTADTSETIFAPLHKEAFANETGGLTLVNTSSTCTQLDVTLSGTTTHVLETKQICEGEAVPLRETWKGPTANWTVKSGGTPLPNAKYAVTATATTAGAKIVGLYQEATVSGTPKDIFNHELFK